MTTNKVTKEEIITALKESIEFYKKLTKVPEEVDRNYDHNKKKILDRFHAHKDIKKKANEEADLDTVFAHQMQKAIELQAASERSQEVHAAIITIVESHFKTTTRQSKKGGG